MWQNPITLDRAGAGDEALPFSVEPGSCALRERGVQTDHGQHQAYHQPAPDPKRLRQRRDRPGEDPPAAGGRPPDRPLRTVSSGF
jgi:hypothetical protein